MSPCRLDPRLRSQPRTIDRRLQGVCDVSRRATKLGASEGQTRPPLLSTHSLLPADYRNPTATRSSRCRPMPRTWCPRSLFCRESATYTLEAAEPVLRRYCPPGSRRLVSTRGDDDSV